MPALKDRQGIDDTAVSLIVLLVCAAAAAGSVAAEQLATRRGSRTAVVLGLATQALAVALIATSGAPVAFVGGFALYGLGLGMVDAAAGIQGVLAQRILARPVMSSFFACYTAAAIVAALAMSVLAARPGSTAWALLAAGAVLAATALLGRSRLVAPGPAAPVPGSAVRAVAVPGSAVGAVAARAPLPRRGIWLFGGVVLVAFVADSAVSTWSSIYLDDTLHASAAVVPLGYAAYQAAILVTRLVADRWAHRSGRARVAAVAAVVGALGFLPVAVLPLPLAAIVGFALVGVGVGALVPLAFSAAGELDDRVDEVVARVNLFNYAGAVLGAVVVGLVSNGPGLAIAFLLPLVLLASVAGVARRFAPAALTGTRGQLGHPLGARGTE
ncbi:MFS transporter [Pengzhenrongella frigida]|uniref:MFS transporter n=1 Tax=Pengzhenrongella frigida TaxID=1259133 RepID=A0A4Q5N476_9MICO|nr:MFS transporter [Cellulomonas sp. HLT2-17]RYV52986.1 MFS transporter [Cellulomonas sp. HLT2-17]